MRRYSEDDGFGFLGQIAAIALGVFIGVLGALMAWESITAWRMEQAARVAAQKMQQSIQQMRQDDQRRQLELERLKNASRDEAAAKQASLFAAEQRQRELVARKEAAWQQFYKPSAACLHDSANILCANAYMAAKKRFDAQYKE